jgi:MOSC domain-containing protein
MRVGTVRYLWRYPVTSMRGERLAGARLGERGMDGDRRYAARDQQTGKIAGAKHPRMWGL